MFDKLMNTMRLNGDDYEEEYDDAAYDDADFDDYDSYDDSYDNNYEEPAPRAKKSTVKKAEAPVFGQAKEKATKTTQSSGRSNKIVPIKSSQNIQEVRVVRPGSYDAAREIIDVLLEGQAAIVNLEGISFDLAAQITDFIFGGCYALDGNIEKVNNFIFIITPSGLEITGDIQNITKKAAEAPYSYQAK